MFVLHVCVFVDVCAVDWNVSAIGFLRLLDILHLLLLWHRRLTGFWFQNGHRRKDGRTFCATNWHRFVFLWIQPL